MKIFFALLFTFLTHGKIILQTVAKVDDKVITTRDVQVSVILKNWLLLNAQSGKKNNKLNKEDWILDAKSNAFMSGLSELVMEYLLVAEASNFDIAKTSVSEVERYTHAFLDEMNTWPYWKKLEVSQVEVEGLISRNLRAKDFLRYRAETVGYRVTDEEAKEYYEKNKVKFNKLPFENFKTSIKEYLSQKDVEVKMKDWVEILRKKYKVKILKTTVQQEV